MTQLRPGHIADIALFAVFFALALLTVSFRSFLPVILSAGGDTFVPGHADWIDVCVDSGRPCLRTVSALVAISIEQFYRLLSGLFFWNVESSSFFAGSPWGLGDTDANTVLGRYVPISAYLTFFLVAMSPLLFISRRLFDGFIARLLVLLVFFSVFVGWHPVLVNVFFNAASAVIDWPRSYYLFSQKLLHYDFGTACILVLAVFYLARPGRRAWWSIMGFAVLAQATMENLGVVFAAGVLFASYAAHRHLPRKTMFRYVISDAAIAAGAAIAAAVVLSFVFLSLADASDVGADGSGGAAGFMSEKWRNTVENNFNWIKTLIANVVTMLVLPILAGALLGAGAGWRADPADDARREDARRLVFAAAGLMLGFLSTMAIGLYFIAYPAEMGRQVLPLAIISVIPAAKLAELAVLRLRSARAGGVRTAAP